jgi:hypothetical protein
MLGVLLVIVDLLRLPSSAICRSQPDREEKAGRTSIEIPVCRSVSGLGTGVPMASLIHQISHPPTGEIRLEEMSFVEHAGFRCGEALVTACFFRPWL